MAVSLVAQFALDALLHQLAHDLADGAETTLSYQPQVRMLFTRQRD
jgi:hypothetical protein